MIQIPRFNQASHQNTFDFVDCVVAPSSYAVVLSLEPGEECIKIFSFKREVLGAELFSDDLNHKVPDQSIVPHDGIEIYLLGNLCGRTADFLYKHLVVQRIQAAITRPGHPRNLAFRWILEQIILSYFGCSVIS